jgi:SAM-dependent methyltransferase
MYYLGPGEPILTILNVLETNKLFNIELYGYDSSKKMLSVAEDRLKRMNAQYLTVQFSNLDDPSNSNIYDIITASLVLPYASDKGQMLRDRYNQLKPKGFLISSHWSHPSVVPFLTVIKGVVGFMANGERIDVSKLETDGSYSCWREEETRQLFTAQGFTIEEYISIDLPMSFPNIRTLLSFCDMCPWFNDPLVYPKAEEETKRILCEDLGFELDFNQSFQLPSTVIVVVASKS